MLISNHMSRNGQVMIFYNIWVSINRESIHYDEKKSKKSSEYIVIYQDELYIASTTP